MKIRKTTKKDVDKVMHLIQQAQCYFKEEGIDQWQDGYPNHEKIEEDIEKDISYVMEIKHEIVATAAISLERDITYDVIEGTWKSNQPYAVIHRICVDNVWKGQNLAKALLQFTQELAIAKKYWSIRMDTHQDNLAMQRFLEKNGFEYCGIITLESGAKRIAFEKLLQA